MNEKKVENYVNSVLGYIRLRETGKRTIISEDDYQDLFFNQKGVCKICDSLETNGKRLAVDHKHGTNIVRGLLCSKCNTGLGLFLDSPGLLFSAIKYLQDAKKLETKYRESNGPYETIKPTIS